MKKNMAIAALAFAALLAVAVYMNSTQFFIVQKYIQFSGCNYDAQRGDVSCKFSGGTYELKRQAVFNYNGYDYTITGDTVDDMSRYVFGKLQESSSISMSGLSDSQLKEMRDNMKMSGSCGIARKYSRSGSVSGGCATQWKVYQSFSELPWVEYMKSWQWASSNECTALESNLAGNAEGDQLYVGIMVNIPGQLAFCNVDTKLNAQSVTPTAPTPTNPTTPPDSSIGISDWISQNIFLVIGLLSALALATFTYVKIRR